MTCRHAISLLEDYVDNELSAEQTALVEQHVSSCLRCREHFTKSKLLKERMSGFFAPPRSAEQWEQTTQLILARSQEPPPAFYRVQRDRTSQARYGLIRSAVSLAVSIFVLVSAMLIGSNHQDQISDSNQPDIPFLVTASLYPEMKLDRTVITVAEQEQLTKGMLLLGPPGCLGRSLLLADLLTELETQ